MNRNFKVIGISEHPNAFGLYGHLLITDKGEFWEVGRSRGTWNTEWKRGDIIIVPSVNGEPQWAPFGVEIPRRREDMPLTFVRQFWPPAKVDTGPCPGCPKHCGEACKESFDRTRYQGNNTRPA